MSDIQFILDPAQAQFTPQSAWRTILLASPVALLSIGAAVFWVWRWGKARGVLPPQTWPLAVALAPLVLTGVDVGIFVLFKHDPTELPLLSGTLISVLAAAAIGLLAASPLASPGDPRPEFHRFSARHTLSAMGLWTVTVPGIMALIILSTAAVQLAGGQTLTQNVLAKLLGNGGVIGVVGAYVRAVIAAPLAEEFTFRLALYGSLRRVCDHATATALSVGLFVLVHGVFSPGQLYLALPLAFLGWLLTEAYARSNSIWPPVAMHMVHNAVVLTLALTTR